MRQLFLLRHAKSDWSNNLPDFDRPLAPRGIKNAGQMGRWMHRQRLHPDYIVASPARRAEQTITLVTEQLQIDRTQIHFDRAIYIAYISELFSLLGEIPATAQRVMLVGHNPSFDQLLEYLSDTENELSDSGKLMATCSLARLDMPDDWNKLRPGCATLIALDRVKNLTY